MLKTDVILTRRLAWALPAGACALVLAVGLLLLLSHFQVLAQPVDDVTQGELSVDKQVSVGQAAPGDTVVYTITVNNDTNSSVSAWMTDSLPAELTLVSGPSAYLGDMGFVNGIVTWSHTLVAHQWAQITFSAQISTEKTYVEIVNTAQVTGTGELLEDSAGTTVVAEVGNLDTAYTYKSVSSDMAEPGDVLTYTIRIENRDLDKPYQVPNAQFTDELLPGLTYITGSLRALDPNATFGFDSGVITWSNTLDYLNYDEVSFSAQISLDLPYDGWITNTVEITTPLYSFTRTAGTWSQRLYGNLDASAKSVAPAWARPGENLNYTIRVVNTGDAVVESAWMTDVLPSEVSYDSGLAATTGSCGEEGDVITWTGSLAPSEAATITFAAQLSSDLSEDVTFTNTAAITGAGTLVSAQASALVKVRFEYYFPLCFRNYPPIPVLNPIPTPGNRSYIVSWQPIEVEDGIDKYVLQQARRADFAVIDQIWSPIYPPNTSQSVSNAYCAYYYRVRADKAGGWGEGPWSNVEQGAASPPDPPALNSIPEPSEDNSYTVSWSSVSVPVGGVVAVDRYVLQEATDANFANVTNAWSLNETSKLVQKGSGYGTFYYRVRADDDDCWGEGTWSNVRSVDTRWSYYDDFSDYKSEPHWPREWSDTRGALYQVHPNEHPKCPGDDCEYDDGDGYVIARRKGSDPPARFGPGVKVPSENYEIKVKARWWDARYYATYQIFFGADASFENYYALQVRVSDVGSENTCMYSLVKRIAGHSTTKLQDWTYSGKIDCRERRDDNDASWNKWKIRREDDQIYVYINGHELGNWEDSRFGANRYFGVGATLFEGFTPSKPEFDDWSVELLD